MNSETNLLDGKCRVCGDVASIYNFNVLSCESCKAFFRRHALRNEVYMCTNNNCSIDKTSRKWCKKCRLVKCFSVGMKKDLVHLRDDKVRRLPSVQTLCSRGIGLSDYELALIEQIQQHSTGKIYLNNEKLKSVTSIFESVKLTVIFTQNYVAFCKNIPEFKSLCHNDQLILIKCSFAEMCAIWNAFLYDVKTSGLSTCQLVNRNIWQIQHKQFTVLIKKAISNDTKIRDLLIVQLLFKIRPNIQCPEFVHHNQQIYLFLLKRYLEQKLCDPVKANFRYRMLANLLNDIGPVSEAISDLFENNKINPTEMNQVCSKMFDCCDLIKM